MNLTNKNYRNQFLKRKDDNLYSYKLGWSYTSDVDMVLFKNTQKTKSFAKNLYILAKPEENNSDIFGDYKSINLTKKDDY